MAPAGHKTPRGLTGQVPGSGPAPFLTAPGRRCSARGGACAGPGSRDRKSGGGAGPYPLAEGAALSARTVPRPKGKSEAPRDLRAGDAAARLLVKELTPRSLGAGCASRPTLAGFLGGSWQVCFAKLQRRSHRNMFISPGGRWRMKRSGAIVLLLCLFLLLSPPASGQPTVQFCREVSAEWNCVGT